MNVVKDNFKSDIRTYGRQFKFEVKMNDIAISEDDVNYIKPSFNTSLFKTIMHQLEIDSKDEISPKTKINLKAGVKLNEPDYEYITYSTYYTINPSERQEDTNSYRTLAYDKMAEAMIDYDLEILEKIPVRNYLIRICQRLGWNADSIPTTFINSEKLIDPTLHIGIGYTFRDVLDEIATITCSFLFFIGENLCLIYPSDAYENIDESYLDEDNITIGEKYFINSLVFSRAENSDNIYRKDDESIEQNGLHEFRISDNQLLSTNDRDLYIDEMFNYLRTFEFYVYDVKSKGILFLEACDRFNFVLNGKTYPTILLNNEIAFEDGLSETLYLDKPEETQTEYKYADETDKRINQTYIIVNKQDQKITQLTSQTTEHEEKLVQHEQDIESLKQSVSNTVNYKREIEGVTELHITDAGKADVLELEIRGNKNYVSDLFPRINLYPRAILQPNQKGG